MRPPLTQAGIVENVDFDWSALHFNLRDGRLALSTGPEGRSVAAVFEGHGTLTVLPPDAIERQQMRFYRGRDRIEESFTEAVFRFASGADFVYALKQQVTFRPLASEGDLGKLLDRRAQQLQEIGRPEAVRVLQALSATVGHRLFYAELHLDDGDWIEAEFDPWRQEPIRVHAWLERVVRRIPLLSAVNLLGNKAIEPPELSGRTVPGRLIGFDDTWAEFKADRAEFPSPPSLSRYEIEANLPNKKPWSFVAQFDVANPSGSGSGVLLWLDSDLRVTSVDVANGETPLEFIQAPDSSRLRVNPMIMKVPQFEGNWLYVGLPTPPSTPLRLKVRYGGKEPDARMALIENRAWYPLSVFGPTIQRADYRLELRMPDSIKTSVSAQVIQDTLANHTRELEATSAGPVPGMGIDLLRGDEKVVSAAVETRSGVAVVRTSDRWGNGTRMVTEAGNALKFLELYTGASPHAIELQEDFDPSFRDELFTNIPEWSGSRPGGTMPTLGVSDGMGWTTLENLPSDCFKDDTLLGEGQHAPLNRLIEYLELEPALAVAHQYFRTLIGWQTPRDQWLADGLANGMALLFVESRYGEKDAQTMLKFWNEELTHSDYYGQVPDEAGPLVLGRRLKSSKDPLAYELVTYDKGAYVLYMLRQMMRGNTHGGDDDAFIAMMHDYVHSFAGRNATTEDFKRIVEAHITPEMDLDHNHKMDWFFDEYVYGTGVDTLQVHSDIGKDADGKSTVTVNVINPLHWKGLLPVYLLSGTDLVGRYLVVVDGSDATKVIHSDVLPDKVEANHFNDMLVEIGQF